MLEMLPAVPRTFMTPLETFLGNRQNLLSDIFLFSVHLWGFIYFRVPYK